MFTMICPRCKTKMKDRIDFFDIKSTYHTCHSCNATLKVSNLYMKIAELLPVVITSIIISIANSLYLTTFERFIVQPIMVVAIIVIAYFLYIGLYPKKLKLKDNESS